MGNSIGGKVKYNNGVIAKYYFPGEQPDGWVLGSTQEKNNKNSISQKKLWENVEYRESHMKTYNSIEYKQRLKESIKKGLSNCNREEWKEHLREGQLKRYSRPEELEKLKNRTTSLWKEPEYRNKVTKSLQNGHKNLYEKHPEYKDKLSLVCKNTWNKNKEEILNKQYQTKSKNKSFNTSKPEETLYIELCEKYGVDNVIRQYRDSRYPFYCDFYIVNEDLFIELNKHWTHGGHPFDETSEEDVKKLNEWVKKSKTSNFYKSAVKVWTIVDPLKIKISKDNNLNIKIIY